MPPRGTPDLGTTELPQLCLTGTPAGDTLYFPDRRGLGQQSSLSSTQDVRRDWYDAPLLGCHTNCRPSPALSCAVLRINSVHACLCGKCLLV